ncbi:uncharacterized protein KY384_002856 [Bacidia gigantensis]|uniref:uncharacterized protein n=1 Tax=Bacidia gigantensis TaxID=2732470 RepID=UPI001D04603A|nr:uncharacterized protein KY384_002856 [Bacidia gigantensis]KAG8532371.1 hypothetical protein KY384_002856 [Bacidia gigantensis]
MSPRVSKRQQGRAATVSDSEEGQQSEEDSLPIPRSKQSRNESAGNMLARSRAAGRVKGKHHKTAEPSDRMPGSNISPVLGPEPDGAAFASGSLQPTVDGQGWRARSMPEVPDQRPATPLNQASDGERTQGQEPGSGWRDHAASQTSIDKKAWAELTGQALQALQMEMDIVGEVVHALAQWRAKLALLEAVVRNPLWLSAGDGCTKNGEGRECTGSGKEERSGDEWVLHKMGGSESSYAGQDKWLKGWYFEHVVSMTGMGNVMAEKAWSELDRTCVRT